jgi:hypothetical protein
MKKLAFGIFAAILASCGSLHSVTTIEANKSFVLGQGRHGSYKAKVQNIGDHPVEVFVQQPDNGPVVSLGVLKPREINNYPVKANTTVMLKNLGSSPATLKLDVKGDTDLSMGYK